jgi:hypothetical protein
MDRREVEDGAVKRGRSVVRRFLLALALGLAISAAAGLTAPSASSPYDSVTGAVKLIIPNYPAAGVSTTEQMMVSAHSGPDGVSGSIEFRSPQADVPVAKVVVTCLVVSGNEAVVGGPVVNPFNYVTRTGDPADRILYFSIRIQDNGEPGHGVPDGVHPVIFIDRPRPPGFQPCGITQPYLPVASGNLVVRDGASG